MKITFFKTPTDSVIELTEGQQGFRSWIRCFGGEVCQDLHFPEAFRKY